MAADCHCVLYAGAMGLKRLYGPRWDGREWLVRPVIVVKDGHLREGFFVHEASTGRPFTAILPFAEREEAGYDLILSYRLLKSVEARSEIGGAPEEAEARIDGATRRAIETAIPPCIEDALTLLIEEGVELDPVPFAIAVADGLLPWSPALGTIGVGIEAAARTFAEAFADELVEFAAWADSEPGSEFNRLLVEGVRRAFEVGIRETDVILGFAFVWAYFAMEVATSAVMPDPGAWISAKTSAAIPPVAGYLACARTRLRTDLAPRSAREYEGRLREAFRPEIEAASLVRSI
jgi:hypothetical protein